MSYTLYIEDKTFEELLALFMVSVRDDDDYYDVIAFHLASEYRKQLECMLPLLSNTRLRGAICGLGLAGPSGEESTRLIETYLSHSDPLIVSEAIDTLRRYGGTSSAHVEALRDHSSPYVRGAVLRFFRSALGAAAAPQLLAALEDPHPIVRENALDELEEIADSSMVSRIQDLLNDESSNVRQAAATLLESLAQEPAR